SPRAIDEQRGCAGRAVCVKFTPASAPACCAEPLPASENNNPACAGCSSRSSREIPVMVRPTGLSRFRALCVLAAVVSAGLSGCATTPSGPREVEIQRTTYGVAHIRAGDYESLAYGVAY